MLALVGSGEYLPPMEPVDRYLLAQLNDPGRVVCLATAAGQEGDERISYWQNLGFDHFTRLGVQVEALPVIDRVSAQDERWAERIRPANFVYLSGGDPEYLYQTFQDTLVWQAILQVHQQGGVLAGCSAGAIIMGERIPGFTYFREGFGLLPNTVIIPHFDEIPQAMIKTAHSLLARKQTLLGVEGNTAVVVFPERCQVVGSGKAVVWNGRHKQIYRQGDTVDCIVAEKV
jgi:cyanophycinase